MGVPKPVLDTPDIGNVDRSTAVQQRVASSSVTCAGILNDTERHGSASRTPGVSRDAALQMQQRRLSAPTFGTLSSPRVPFVTNPALGARPFAACRVLDAAKQQLSATGSQLMSPTPHSLGGTRSYYTEGQLMGHAFLVATDIMFWSGLVGAAVFRRNIIVMLLCTELVMLACNLNFLYAAAYLNDMTGVIMSITITTIAACETAIGLALCVTYFHMRSSSDVEALNFLK
ncbi:hypothetical protein QJQ45_030265 [Haematococcus lacustris]|nr:hypothetical protein QJQ45_014676 [Haematococcus lacustris]KAJ9520093.1 hypothetical protein QJQ45_030020 [Haematococcus lacustris]KAJ9520270.1 hypothetical protein QJQ45_030265 [Haematococcus lacustris]